MMEGKGQWAYLTCARNTDKLTTESFAISAGKQIKNSRVQPLVTEEMEAGKVVEEMLKLKHPLMEKCEKFPKEIDHN